MRYLLPAIVFCTLGAIVPWLWFWSTFGITSIPPEFVDDSIYYYSRMDAVAEGYPFIGNPYFKEHADEMASAFFGADWIAALPLLLGVPLIPTLILNTIVWTILFVLAAWYLLREWGMTERHTLAATCVLFLTHFWLLERPVAMQIVFPAYLLFLVALTRFTNEQSRFNVSLLGGSIALSFYLYTYLWMAVVVTVGCAVLFGSGSIIERIRFWFWSGIVAISGAIPMVYYTFLQTQHEWYWETVMRIGFIETRTFGMSGVILAAVVTLGLVLCWFLNGSSRYIAVCAGVGLLLVSFSNVITAKDLETAVHFMRFVTLWIALVSVLLISQWSIKRFQKAVLVAAFAVLIFLGFDQIKTTNIILANTHSFERYAPVLAWLSAHAEKGSVILAEDAVAKYIPLMTPHFTLFHPNGGLYLMPTEEMKNRYLVSRLFETVDMQRAHDDMRLYAGAGNSIHSYKTKNREKVLCRIIRKDCGEPLTRESYWGAVYFSEMTERFQFLKKNPKATLDIFGVDYIVIDAKGKSTDWDLTPLKVVSMGSFGDMTLFKLR